MVHWGPSSLLLTLLPLLYFTACSTALKPPLSLSADDLGIEYRVLPGIIPFNGTVTPSPDKPGQFLPIDGHSVLLHIYAKRVIDKGKVSLEGFLFAESADTIPTSAPYCCLFQPPVVQNWGFPLYFEDAENTTSDLYIPKIWKPRQDRGTQFFAVDVPADASCFKVHVFGWVRHALICFSLDKENDSCKYLRRGSPTAAAQKDPTLPTVWTLIKPFRADNVQHAAGVEYANILAANIQWHAVMGFSGVITAESRQGIQKILQNKQLKKYAEDGSLMLMNWENLFSAYNNQRNINQRCYDQCIQHNYVLVAFSACNARIAVVDVDEYFTTAKPGVRVLDAMQTCLPTKFEFDTANVARYDVFYPRTPEEDQNSDLHLWNKTYSSFADHPLHSYTLVSKKTTRGGRGKEFINVATRRVYSFLVHWGHTREGAVHTSAPTICAFWAHVSEMWRSRGQVITKAATDRLSWQWPWAQ